MFTKLQQRWKVSGWNLLLILITFALGGSLCGFLGRKLLLISGLGKGVIWVIIYIILVTLLWPVCVLLVSIPLGQFRFFRNYISKIMNKLSNKKTQVPIAKLAVFASGGGSNANNIIQYFKDSATIKIAVVVCNKPGAGVINIAKTSGIPLLMIDREDFRNPRLFIQKLQSLGITHIILAGFLWKVPDALIRAYPEKILNIHPSLLPKYGGKGMYGKFVHEAVLASGDQLSGMTIHLVDEQYDHGRHLYQATCEVLPGDSIDDLAIRIHQLEHLHFPVQIEAYIKKQNQR